MKGTGIAILGTFCIIILLAIVIFSSCQARWAGAGGPINSTQVGYSQGSVERFIDTEAMVVCWTFDTYNGGGISCLPLSDTNLFVK